MKGIKSFRRTFLLIAALYLACGISLLVWPAQSGLVICYVFGGISLLYGAVQIIRYCCNAAVSIFRYELVTGILCCAFGLFVILRADMVLAVLPFVFGCAIVFDSVMTLQNAIDLRRLGFSRWWLILLLAGVTGAFGVLLFYWVKRRSVAWRRFMTKPVTKQPPSRPRAASRTSPSREAEQNKNAAGPPCGAACFCVKRGGGRLGPPCAPMLSGVKSKQAQSANAPCETRR